jgi:ATP-binding cassette subfamily B protein
MLIVPLMGLVTRVVARQTRRWYRSQQQHLGALNGLIEETVTGQRVVKAYGREADTISRFDTANAAYRGFAIKAQIASGVLGPLAGFVNNVAYAIIAVAGGWLVIGGLATVGVVAAFINYARQFGRPLNQIAGLYNTIQSALAGAERVFEVIDEVPEVQDSPQARNLAGARGHVEFRDVYFAYTPEVTVLKGVGFEAKPGQTIALVGPTGAGKTTVVNLLTRFYDIDRGAILVDGTDIRDLQKDSLRRRLGIVLQDTFLFSGTVRENIRYGRLDATDADIRRAAETANAHAFIRHLPSGYDTPLREDAANLSQGQRQLLAIARAVLADPDILVLDEATSSVDTRTEVQIQQAMLRLMKGRTSFVIAHRLSTIRGADLILVVEDGRIVERGNHRQLMHARGSYASLYQSQFRGLKPIV